MAQFLIGKTPVQQQITVGNSATLIPTTPLTGRESIIIKNFSGETCYLGNASVASADGFPLEVGESLPLAIVSQAAIYGITASGTADIRILEAV